jgi:hypothetical protein
MVLPVQELLSVQALYFTACPVTIVLPVQEHWYCMYGRCGTVCTGAVVLPVQQLVSVACAEAELRLYGSCGAACAGVMVLPVQELMH